MPPKKRARSTTKGNESAASTPPIPSDTAEVAAAAAAVTTTATTAAAATTTVTKAGLRIANDAKGGDAVAPQKLPADLQDILLRSSVIAPDVIGIRCIAVHPDERQIAVAREDASLVLYDIDTFQNILHFQQVRHSGGRAQRTITRLHYLPATTAPSHAFLIASYLSGQFVVYCTETLAPLYVHQRTGGAVWDFCVASRQHMYAAMADGSWQQLRVRHNAGGLTMSLERIVPKVTGADRALSVCCAPVLRIAVGTDDAGHVTAWRIPSAGRSADPHAKGNNNNNENKSDIGNAIMELGESLSHDADNDDGGDGSDEEADSRGAGRSLGQHESLWTSRLPKGIGLCCAICHSAAGGPVVAVGTSMGDVALFDAARGHALKTFSHHKGPVSTITADSAAGVFYASGWHESLRAYRCGTDGEWYPAEVKRRTHYHEASELCLMRRRQFILSAARDGTIMYAPLASVFTSPAMYVPVTTQQFAFAREKNVLLQTRAGRIEGFRTDASMRHWAPLFAYKVHSKFHLVGLWCDAQMHYILFATDERAALLRIDWRDGAEAALALHRIEEVVGLSVGRGGALDCCFVRHSDPSDGTATESCYVLLDDAVLHITLAEGYPVVSTALPDSRIRPMRLMRSGVNGLIVCGHRGRVVCSTVPDGTIDANSFVTHNEPISMASAVPMLRRTRLGDAVGEEQEEFTDEPTIVALTNGERYVAGLESETPLSLPRSLPHDARFVARLPPTSTDGNNDKTMRFLAVFSRGLLYVTEKTWHMVQRCAVEAAFVMRGEERVLVLVRNLEGTLEALPMCWRVRRFGN